MKNPKSILITGGSSGMGEELAKSYAKEGITLFLSGRNEERLNNVKRQCESLGADVYVKIIDVRDEDAMSNWMTECDEIAALDLVVANAGTATGFNTDMDLASYTKNMMDINVNGAFHTIHPAIRLMQPRGRGQIAIMSSLSGYHGSNKTPAYPTTKACVKTYGEGLRAAYAHLGIEINVVCPGFIKTPFTEGAPIALPFLMDVDKAMIALRRGLEKNQGRITFPWTMSLISSAMVRFLPERLFLKAGWPF